MAGKVKFDAESVAWLADAPMFIDGEQISRFYDSVVRPDDRVVMTTEELRREVTESSSQKVAGEGEFSLGKLFGLFPGVKAKASMEKGGEEGKSNSNSTETQRAPIVTPERQLLQLTIHYYDRHSDRLLYVPDLTESSWREAHRIRAVPRAIAFLDLPGEEEAESRNVPRTTIIPLAAEFENGRVITLYKSLPKSDCAPKYPSSGTAEDKAKDRKAYWEYFTKHFNAYAAMECVENAVKDNGLIKWIDYRLPMTSSGETLHLHVAPDGKYSTGTFAYKFIKRGEKHGLRLVGTLKSEPDLNVLAVYEK